MFMDYRSKFYSFVYILDYLQFLLRVEIKSCLLSLQWLQAPYLEALKRLNVMDDPFVSCPYNPMHRVPRSRIQAHIVKCQKNYPELAICPFNATHRYPAEFIKAHVANCPTKAAMFPEELPVKNTGKVETPKPILQKEYLPETDPNHEIWDD